MIKKSNTVRSINIDEVSFNVTYDYRKVCKNLNIQTSDPILKVYKILYDNSFSLNQISMILNDHKSSQIHDNLYSQNSFTENGSQTVAKVIQQDKNGNDANHKNCILWCINHYTGLNRDPRVIEAGKNALDQFGTGSGTSALSGGHSRLHKRIESRIASFIGKDDAVFFPTGYTANLGAISALCTQQDLILFDRECHASIMDGVKLSGSKFMSFKHNDCSDLKKKLERTKNKYREVFVIIESAYSMSGDIAPIKQITELKEHYDFYLYVDEAHTFGIYNNQGRGLCFHLGLVDKVDFIMSTLSKATASIGGFVACKKQFRPILEWKANAYIFQAAASPADCAVVLKSLDLLESEPSIIQKIHTNNYFMRGLLNSAGFDLGNSQSPVISIRISDDDILRKVSGDLYVNGVFTIAVVYPAVKNGQGLLRFIINRSHTDEQITKTVNILKNLFIKYNLSLINKHTTDSLQNA